MIISVTLLIENLYKKGHENNALEFISGEMTISATKALTENIHFRNLSANSAHAYRAINVVRGKVLKDYIHRPILIQ